jgi:hypothetical protein
MASAARGIGPSVPVLFAMTVDSVLNASRLGMTTTKVIMSFI